MPHFFISSKEVKDGKAVICDKDNYNHIVRALRARAGERLLLIDEGKIQYETVIEAIGDGCIIARIEKSYKTTRDLGFGLYLAQVPLRSDAQNFIIEKATELGAAGIYPVMSDNCAVKKSVVESKIEKWQRIAFEASKQCERAAVPEIFSVAKLEDLPQFDKIIVFCERNTDLALKQFLRADLIKLGEKILVIVGPEGGFSDRELEYFKNEKIPMITLGNLILKAETAVIAALGNIIYEYN